jgi:hypothetical protein
MDIHVHHCILVNLQCLVLLQPWCTSCMLTSRPFVCLVHCRGKQCCRAQFCILNRKPLTWLENLKKLCFVLIDVEGHVSAPTHQE